jgi:rubrerythrin
MDKTIINLAKAFVGESMARNRYTQYRKVAKDEQMEQVAAIFEETANQEKEHAGWLFKLINELMRNKRKKFEELQIETPVPTVLGNTKENLEAAIAGEHYEFVEMYPKFAKVATEEGYKLIAARLRSIAIAESHHEERYKKLLKEVKTGSIHKKTKEVWWVCRECGYMIKAKQPPVKCPSCDHARSYFQLKCEQF